MILRLIKDQSPKKNDMVQRIHLITLLDTMITMLLDRYA